ncbi:MAG: hypothetical protein ACRDRH_23015 [Pseudonocardia sp.]
MTLVIRPAKRDDVEHVVALVTEAAAWLAERGSDQWQYPAGVHDRVIRKDIDRGEAWIVQDDTGYPVATATLNQRADPELWTDWAGGRAVSDGKKLLRLDAWSNNTDLHRYYLRRGFHCVRRLHFSHRGSGALFERPAESRLNLGSQVVDQHFGAG